MLETETGSNYRILWSSQMIRNQGRGLEVRIGYVKKKGYLVGDVWSISGTLSIYNSPTENNQKIKIQFLFPFPVPSLAKP